MSPALLYVHTGVVWRVQMQRCCAFAAVALVPVVLAISSPAPAAADDGPQGVTVDVNRHLGTNRVDVRAAGQTDQSYGVEIRVGASSPGQVSSEILDRPPSASSSNSSPQAAPPGGGTGPVAGRQASESTS